MGEWKKYFNIKGIHSFFVLSPYYLCKHLSILLQVLHVWICYMVVAYVHWDRGQGWDHRGCGWWHSRGCEALTSLSSSLISSWLLSSISLVSGLLLNCYSIISVTNVVKYHSHSHASHVKLVSTSFLLLMLYLMLITTSTRLLEVVKQIMLD